MPLTISKYTTKERDSYAAECYEMICAGKTTISQYASQHDVERRLLYRWLSSRYGYKVRQKKKVVAADVHFVKVSSSESAREASSIEIEYHGAMIKVAGDEDLRRVLQALKEVAI